MSQQGLRARIEPQGVTGINYIEINYVNDPNQFPPLAVDWKPHYYYIPSAPGQLTNMLDSINSIMRQVEELNIGGMSNSLTDLLANLNKAVTGADITKVSADLQTLLGEFRETLKAANIARLSEDARKMFEAARQMIDGLEKSNTAASRGAQKPRAGNQNQRSANQRTCAESHDCQRELRSVQRGGKTQALTAPVGHSACSETHSHSTPPALGCVLES